jgi:hypothetical protein
MRGLAAFTVRNGKWGSIPLPIGSKPWRFTFQKLPSSDRNSHFSAMATSFVQVDHGLRAVIEDRSSMRESAPERQRLARLEPPNLPKTA